MYNSALVMQQQMQAIGINAQLKVVDWPTSAQHGAEAGHRLELLLHRLGHAAGARARWRPCSSSCMPGAVYMPKGGQDDPELLASWNDMNSLPTVQGRKEAFAKMQKYALEQVYTLPLGSLTKVQAVRSNVKGYRAVSAFRACPTSGSRTEPEAWRGSSSGGWAARCRSC